MTPAPQRNDRLDQAFNGFPVVETGVSLWIESSENPHAFRPFKTCSSDVRAGFIDIKTKGTCWRDSDIVWSVPQFKWGRVEIGMPSIKVSSKRRDFYWDLPTVTVRDNKGDLDKANDDTARTKRELEQGTEAIKGRVMASAWEEVTGILDKASKDPTRDRRRQGQGAGAAPQAEAGPDQESATRPRAVRSPPPAKAGKPTLPSPRRSRCSTRAAKRTSPPASSSVGEGRRSQADCGPQGRVSRRRQVRSRSLRFEGGGFAIETHRRDLGYPPLPSRPASRRPRRAADGGVLARSRERLGPEAVLRSRRGRGKDSDRRPTERLLRQLRPAGHRAPR